VAKVDCDCKFLCIALDNLFFGIYGVAVQMSGCEWKDAVERSKIPRISYKDVLGCSLTSFVLANKFKSNDEIMRIVLLELRKPQNKMFLNGIPLSKAGENLRICLSARRTEQKIYKERKK